MALTSALNDRRTPLLVSCKEASYLLGISQSTLRRMIWAGEVPSQILRPSRRRGIPLSFLLNYTRDIGEREE